MINDVTLNINHTYQFSSTTLAVLDMKDTKRQKDRHGLHVVYFMYFTQAMHNNLRSKQISCSGTLP